MSPRPPERWALATESGLREREFPASRLDKVVREVSAPLTLIFGGVLLLALVVRLVLADRIVTPWIMIDELIYSELAKNFADHGDFVLRDAASNFHNIAYPVLISPAWLAESIETAYGVRAGDQRRRDGSGRRSCLPLGQAADAGELRVARGDPRAAHAATHLHRDADDGERVPAGGRLGVFRDRVGARAPDAAPAGARIGRDRTHVCRASPGSRAAPHLRDGAGAQARRSTSASRTGREAFATCETS